MIKVKIISMARKRERNQEAYTRLGFVPKQKELNATKIVPDDSVRWHNRLRK